MKVMMPLSIGTGVIGLCLLALPDVPSNLSWIGIPIMVISLSLLYLVIQKYLKMAKEN